MPLTASVSDDLYPAEAVATGAAGVQARPRSGQLVALFSATLFVSASLMFLVEPMMAKMVLPLLGGAPAVWNTCLVFFQVVLLGGYAYAHGATRWLGRRRHIVVHSVLLLLPLLVLPIAMHQAPPAVGQEPVAWLILVLTGSIGLPFFVVSTSAAVLQKWFSATDDEAARDPYFLYVASNLGSFIALIAYPLVVEPTLRLQDQARLWTVGYGILVVLSLACAIAVWRRGGPALDRAWTAIAVESEPVVSWARRGRWIALAFVPSSLLLAVTNYISTDVASVPLLWVVPLSLYLLAFAVAFSPSAAGLRAIAARLMPVLVLTLTLMLAAGMLGPLWLVIPLHLVVFLTIAVVCHGDLADDRPSPTRLTEFYFWIACGGMLGGLFNALIAPVLFVGIAEYPIMLVAACLLRSVPQSAGKHRLCFADVAVPLAVGAAVAVSALVNNRYGSFSRLILLGAAGPALIALSQKRHPVRFAASIAMFLLAATLTETLGHVVYSARTFFGVYHVLVDEARGYRFMVHGTTLHGMQSLDPGLSDEPMSYYHRTGPVGQIVAALPHASTASDVAVVGLGIGTLASYRAPAQHWTFYEIDPMVEVIARNASYFTYLQHCGDNCTVITGDGRVSLAREAPQKYGIIVLDAFSSDAVPMHLMTREAMALYLSRLAPGGAIVFNISNMHMSFSAVLAHIAADAGLSALWQHEPPDAGSWQLGKIPSEWVVVARDRRDLGGLTSDVRWKVPPVPGRTPLWTDDFSNILSVLRHDGA